jgi:alanine racemase
VGEGVEVRRALSSARIVVFGPSSPDDVRVAREARLELVVAVEGERPTGVAHHLKLDTGMGRWGLSELVDPTADVVGLMTHFAAAEADLSFTTLQLERFLQATAPFPGIKRHAANSAAALGMAASRLDAARCGIALYGIDPWGRDGGRHGLRPALRWESELARVRLLQPGESTGYGRCFVAREPTWVGIVPVGYADGFSRDLTGTTVLVEGEPAEVVGTVSMDSFAVRLAGRRDLGADVVLVGDGITFEQHAAVAGTIGYELACAVRTDPARSVRMMVG